ncbi:MAG TPA: hypothetical protein ENN80_12745 [Candidatus Hydrogenedentes bacterium]|nr:hypothetical protein [Candidatus Hydrogenedentota bacterium]
MPITEMRTVQMPARLPQPGASSAQRFGFGAHAPAAGQPSTESPSPVLAWEAPEGWERLGPRSMRVVSFRVGNSDEAECYVSLLRGNAGGVEGNINRWRGQMGLEPLDAGALAAQPHIEALGQRNALLDVAGDYADMQGDVHDDYALMGIVCALDDWSVFVKMIGPREVVQGEAEAFKAFCASLRLEGGHG